MNEHLAKSLIAAIPHMKLCQCKNFIGLIGGAVIVSAGIYIIATSAYNIGIEEALVKVSEKIFEEV